MNRTHYEITRPYDWQDKLAFKAYAFIGCALVMAWAFTS